MNQEQNDLSNLFPNSPAPPGSEAARKQAEPSEADKALYLKNEVIELPSPPSLQKYSPGRTEEVRVGEAGLHIANALRDSFQYGGDYKKDFDHWTGCLKALKIDPHTLGELSRLREELDKTHNLDKHRKIIFEDARALFLDLRPGGRK